MAEIGGGLAPTLPKAVLASLREPRAIAVGIGWGMTARCQRESSVALAASVPDAQAGVSRDRKAIRATHLMAGSAGFS